MFFFLFFPPILSDSPSRGSRTGREGWRRRNASKLGRTAISQSCNSPIKCKCLFMCSTGAANVYRCPCIKLTPLRCIGTEMTILRRRDHICSLLCANCFQDTRLVKQPIQKEAGALDSLNIIFKFDQNLKKLFLHNSRFIHFQSNVNKIFFRNQNMFYIGAYL